MKFLLILASMVAIVMFVSAQTYSSRAAALAAAKSAGPKFDPIDEFHPNTNNGLPHFHARNGNSVNDRIKSAGHFFYPVKDWPNKTNRGTFTLDGKRLKE